MRELLSKEENSFLILHHPSHPLPFYDQSHNATHHPMAVHLSISDKASLSQSSMLDNLFAKRGKGERGSIIRAQQSSPY
jgi:hypothetical protein